LYLPLVFEDPARKLTRSRRSAIDFRHAAGQVFRLLACKNIAKY
jgi:hypothetical protein